jgi:phospholipid-binding lipoprotein MlaA
MTVGDIGTMVLRGHRAGGCRHLGLAGLAMAGLLAGCGPAPIPQGIDDPGEAQNRAVHEINKDVDRTVLRPVSQAYGAVVPGPGQILIANVGGNVGLPSAIANGLLQADVGGAAQNTMRFLINTTVGIGGIFDPATAMGVPEVPTDFGETLHRWGVPEGHYVELPLLGPTTDRDMLGMAVDVFLNPLRFVLPTVEANWATGFQIAAGIGARSRYSDTIESVLYESADSYAQTRLLYLQNRRFELGGNSLDEDFVDPYEDPYAE